jgi:hypothetical protein
MSMGLTLPLRPLGDITIHAKFDPGFGSCVHYGKDGAALPVDFFAVG